MNNISKDNYLKFKEDDIFIITEIEGANNERYQLGIFASDIYHNMEPCFHFFNKELDLDIIISLVRPKILYKHNDSHELYYNIKKFSSVLIGNSSDMKDSIWARLNKTWDDINIYLNNLEKQYTYRPIPNYTRYLFNSISTIGSIDFINYDNSETKYNIGIYTSDIDITEPCFHLYNTDNPDYVYNNICISLIRPIYLYSNFILTASQIDIMLDYFHSYDNNETIWNKLVSSWFNNYYMFSEIDNIIFDGDNTDYKDLNKKLTIPDYKGGLL